jgi:hypothetical protein
MCFINISEWIKIGVLKNIDNYPFGSEGPTPYYYKSAACYSAIMLVSGIIFLGLLLFGIWSVIKGNRNRVKVALGLTLGFIVLSIINGYIKL